MKYETILKASRTNSVLNINAIEDYISYVHSWRKLYKVVSIYCKYIKLSDRNYQSQKSINPNENLNQMTKKAEEKFNSLKDNEELKDAFKAIKDINLYQYSTLSENERNVFGMSAVAYLLLKQRSEQKQHYKVELMMQVD